MFSCIDKLWYDNKLSPLRWVLWPLAWLFKLSSQLRRWFLQHFFQIHFPIPIIVVGNITLGGVGKTPLVIALAQAFHSKGLKVGIVSRGYKARCKTFPYQVQKNDSALNVGDEPLLLAQKTGCPVVIDPKRTRAVRYLLDTHQCQIIISDDGLQHYRMGRAIELIVIDGTRGIGNGLCLPAGPLREPAQRLKQVDLVVVNQSNCSLGQYENAYPMILVPQKPVHLATLQAITHAFDEEVAAVAGIGNPQRFYFTLSQMGIKYKPYSYPDHYQFKLNDLNYPQSLIIMTEKDAVKCLSFNKDCIYYLPVDAVLTDAFWNALWSHKHLQGYY